CNPYSVKATGVSDSITDEITWNVNGTITPNPVEFTQTGTYIESIKRVKNGCVTNATVKVTSNTPQPSIIPPVTAVKDGNGNVIMDTLTCIKNSVLMNFTSDVAQYKIELKQPAPLTDTLPNNSTVATPGFYTVFIKDLNTLCKGNPLLVEVKSDKAPPYLALPGTVPTINCSFSEALLDGQSATPGAQLVWTGSGGFSSADPATVTKPGEYILTVTDPHNGCIKKDTLEVIKENSLVLKGQADTIICIGSEIELTTKPVGGTPAFTYAWSTVAGNNESIKVKPTTTTTYSVTVIDAVNCVGKDTIIVKVPGAIHDSTITFAPCDPASINGQIQIFASGGIPPYMYSNDKGITYQNSQIFSNLAFGTYQLSVKDSLGCTHDFSKSIDAQSQKPTSDFIINTNMMAKDTFVVVDISNPRPDTIIWKFPASVKVINTNFYAPIIVSNDTGEVNVIMETHFGTCVNNLTKKVKFIKKDTTISPTKGNGIEELNIFPNPNTGEFTVEVKLFKKQRLAIYVFDTQGVEQIRVVEPIVDYSINNIVLPVKTPGTYILKVIAEYDSKAKGIIVTQ
ncbi:MAG TPA: T9SS type A sorting domain-containing protein, partial [Bacteroidia bacterium]|nr:T9SS type A sorting domain-containing protein [Bacteroidia bacterium]